MLFVVLTRDHPGHGEVRQSLRPAHLAWLDALGETVVLAGPFLGEDGAPCGSLLVFEASSFGEVQEIASRDPYAQGGLFSQVEIRPWRWTVKPR